MSDIDDMIDRLTDRQQREFALACARRVQHLMRDPRSTAVMDVADRHMRGEATDEEMEAARVAAWTAVDEEWNAIESLASAAAWASARNAVLAVADASGMTVARDSARTAVWAVARAMAYATDAKLAAERAAEPNAEWAAALAPRGDAARAAVEAAQAAAWEIERAWQRAELERMLKEGGGA